MNCLPNGKWIKILDDVKEELIDKKSNLITIPNADILNSNSTSISAVSGSGMYAIWVNGMCKYIGETNNLLRRLGEHLFGPSTPGNQHSIVSNYASVNVNVICVSYVVIKPSSMRLAIEDAMIYKLTKSNFSLPWNKKSVSKTNLQKWVLDYLNNSTIWNMKAAWALELNSAYTLDFGNNNRLDAVLKSMVSTGTIQKKRKKIGHKFETFYYL